MRLAALDRGQRIPAKVFLRLVGAMSRDRPPDVLRMLCYRPAFFGRDFSKAVHAVLRGPSAWTVGERELFAAYTSYLNQCVF